ncbi:P-loop containing nucleoside triphosphate hydrolase protein [Lasiosphaeris hirsuta]|uniref:P-loop containing nucleoside triphosphate hydrolase protein n=1 Tax=Lasiosphaeris hirsuta TaxID=260670 RepID=A0AA40E9W0_9PEZI|nr:P-loop containing nucleoside triphosphate hydrolase protein [Lasiosphaeris hirsuta]
MDLVAATPGEQQAEREVPDILYVVQTCGPTGQVFDTRVSDKPMDKAPLNNQVRQKNPVIAIKTRISATAPPGGPPGNHWNNPRPPGMRPPPRRATSVASTSMVIHSPHLRAALAAVIDYSGGFETYKDTMVIAAPYQVLIHHWAALEHYRDNQPACHDAVYAATTAKHIDIVLSFLKEKYGEKIEAETRRWNSPEGATATHNFFWLLLKPGEIIYKDEDDTMTPYVVSSVRRSTQSDAAFGAYVVNHWNIEYMNNRLQRHMYSTHVQPWAGERAITSLPVIPARFVPGGAKEMAEYRVSLGRQYWELAKQPSYREYQGMMKDKDGNDCGNMSGRVVVDCEGWALFGDSPNAAEGKIQTMNTPRRHPGAPPVPKDNLPQKQPHCPCDACRQDGLPRAPSAFAGFEYVDPKKNQPPANEALYFHVFSDLVPAFLLGERRWAFLKTSNLREVRPDTNAFKYLVLEDEVKLTVKALIGKFASSDGKVSPWPSDFVKNKGEGRIFLLHGPPGVGKTCTAECIAELTRRPLLSLTSGDISTSMSAGSVEHALNYFLSLGERFGALVLLDEADVYLEARRTRDLRRNGLVSVFLRALEYYKGVLFLTTNRVEAFDSAFTSRIHVALHYKRLNDTDRGRIWVQNFERLERDSAGKCYVPASTRLFALESPEMRRLTFNGREIRNALQTAVALAETEALEDGVETVTVGEKHLRSVAKMSSGFKDFLRRRRRVVKDEYEDEEEEEDEEEVDEESSSDESEELADGENQGGDGYASFDDEQ